MNNNVSKHVSLHLGGTFIDRYISGILRRPWLVIATSILVVLSVGSGGRFLGLATDYRIGVRYLFGCY